MLSSVLTSSAVALAGLLVARPLPIDALATPPGSGSQLGHVAARHLPGVSPHHQALARRKRNVHKNRKRCQQRPASSTPSPSPSPSPASQQSDNNPGDYNHNYSTNNNGDNTGNTGDNTGNNNTGDNTNNNTNNSSSASSASSSTSGADPAVTPILISPSPDHGKLGLAWPNGAFKEHNSQYFTGKAGIYYTWSAYKVEGDNNLKFCPMLWGRGWDEHIKGFVEMVKPGYADCVLGMNEPNEAGQSNMGPEEAVGLWQQYITPLAGQGYKIFGSPAPSSETHGIDWVKSFVNLLKIQNGVQPTHICIHYYDIDPNDFINYVTKFHNDVEIGNRPIWVTEFACQNFNDYNKQCSKEEVHNFYKLTTAWMDQTSWVEYYFPFGFMREMQGVNPENQLMDQDGNPTELGTIFLNGSF